MRVDPSKPVESAPAIRTKEMWVPADQADTIKGTRDLGSAYIGRAARTESTAFTAQQKGMENKTIGKTNQLGRCLPYFPHSGDITRHAVEAF